MFRSSRTASAADDAPGRPAAPRRRRPSLGTALGATALFVALGGTSYAAATLPAKSVGATQLKTGAVTSAKIGKNAITAAKVKDGSLLLKDFKAGQLPTAGPGTGVAGPAGPKGDTGAKGEAGAKGEPGPLLDVLPSGRTQTGMFGVAGHKAGGSDYVARAAISFPVALATLPSSHVVSGAPTTDCPGTVGAPAAAPGHLCFYADLDTGGSGLSRLVTKHGATFYVQGLGAATDYEWTGSWAVTAP